MFTESLTDRRYQHRKLLEIALMVSLAMHIVLLQGDKRVDMRPIRQLSLPGSISILDTPPAVDEHPKPPPDRPTTFIPSEVF